MEKKVDRGWGRLPRLICEKLAGIKLGEYESKVIWAIVYFTIGYSRYDDWIAQSQIVKMTGIDQRNLYRTLKTLVKKGIIYKKDVRYRLIIEFNIVESKNGKEYNNKYIWGGKEYICRDVKNTSVETDSKDSSKDLYPKKVVSEVKMTRKEIYKMEGLEWIRAEMVYRGEWDIKFIDELVSKHPFMKLYDCWDELERASNVRDRKAWYLYKLDNWVDSRR